MAPKNSATSRCALGEADDAVLGAALQHPVEQVAGGDEVDADQPAARDLTMSALPSWPSILARVAPMSPTSWPDSSTLDCCTRPGSSFRVDSMKLLEASLTSDSDGETVETVAPLMRARHLRALPRRRRDLVGDAVVDRRLVELVGAVRQAQRLEARQPVGRVGIAHAGRRRVRQHFEQPLAAQPAHLQRLRWPSGGTARSGGRRPRRRSTRWRSSRAPRAAASAGSACAAAPPRRRRPPPGRPSRPACRCASAADARRCAASATSCGRLNHCGADQPNCCAKSSARLSNLSRSPVARYRSNSVSQVSACCAREPSGPAARRSICSAAGSKSPLAKAITASSSSGSWANSLTSIANGLREVAVLVELQPPISEGRPALRQRGRLAPRRRRRRRSGGVSRKRQSDRSASPTQAGRGRRTAPAPTAAGDRRGVS